MLLAIPLLRYLKLGGLGFLGCLGILILILAFIAFSVLVGGWFWGDLVYNSILAHPGLKHALTTDQWLLVGAIITVI